MLTDICIYIYVSQRHILSVSHGITSMELQFRLLFKSLDVINFGNNKAFFRSVKKKNHQCDVIIRTRGILSGANVPEFVEAAVAVYSRWF